MSDDRRPQGYEGPDRRDPSRQRPGRKDNALDVVVSEVRRWVALGAMAGAGLTWLGMQYLSPGQRIDQVDQNARLRDAVQDVRDSLQDVRINRLAAMVALQALRECMRSPGASAESCNDMIQSVR